MTATTDLTNAPASELVRALRPARSAAANCSSATSRASSSSTRPQRDRHARRRGRRAAASARRPRHRSRPRRRRAARVADHDQGLARDGRHAHHLRSAGSRRLRPRARRRRGRPAARGRCGDLRQDQPADVRDGLADVQPGVRHDEQPVGPRPARRAARPAVLRPPSPPGLTGLELGSDIRGSLRQPAHNTGIFTLKPSFGIVPVRGHIPGPPGTLSAPDLGCSARWVASADDLDLALDVLAGPDAAMATAWRLRLPRPAAPLADRLSDRGVAGRRRRRRSIPPCCDVLASAVQDLQAAGAQSTTAARPVDLAEASAVFEKLFLAAVSPGAADWNVTNEHRQQLRAQWQRFFRVLRRDPDSGLAGRRDRARPRRRPGHPHHHRQRRSRVPTPTSPPGPAWRAAHTCPRPSSRSAAPEAACRSACRSIAPYLEDRTAIDVARHDRAAPRRVRATHAPILILPTLSVACTHRPAAPSARSTAGITC